MPLAAGAQTSPQPADTVLGAPVPAGAEAARTVPASWLRLDALPFIPIPEISTAPHAGVTVGLLPVVLSNNSQGQIDRILAPDIIYSQYFGWGARWRTFKNVSEDEKWSVVGGAKQSVEREFDAEYDLGLSRDRNWSWIWHAMYDRSGTGRFFGFGNNTAKSAETTFIDSQIRAEMTAARNFTHSLQLAYQLRVDTVEIEQSALRDLPTIETRYPNLLGVGDATELQQRLVLSYDTRDSVTIPHRGMRLAAFSGFTTRALGSSISYSFVGADGTYFQPEGDDLTVVTHAAARYMPTFTNAPFWAYSQLGGDRSIVGEDQPLRGFASGRFVDRNSVGASIEARFWVQSYHMFDTDLKLELAPFIDSGKVFTSMSESPLSHLHVAGGMGFRMIASPFVVAYVDMGFGKEKFSVFTGIEYPF